MLSGQLQQRSLPLPVQQVSHHEIVATTHLPRISGSDYHGAPMELTIPFDNDCTTRHLSVGTYSWTLPGHPPPRVLEGTVVMQEGDRNVAIRTH